MISLERLMAAANYYQQRGFQPVSVPHVVSCEVSNLTRPLDRNELFHDEGKTVYSASAEHGFLELLSKGEIEEGSYQAITPCYRDEPELDNIHFKVFLKLELAMIGGEAQANADYMCEVAKKFFRSLGIKPFKVNAGSVLSPLQCDLVTGQGLELGSYGVRSGVSKPYAYGTGMAEPRTSYVVSLET